MRDQEKRPLLTELASIVTKRNLIDRRRCRARYKVAYYTNIKHQVCMWNLSSPSLSTIKNHLKDTINPFDRRNLQKRIALKEKEMIDERRFPCPTKWLKKTRELNRLILKYEAEAAQARYEIAQLTCDTNMRVRYINNQLSSRINYNNGQVDTIIVPKNDKEKAWLNAEEIEILSNEHEGFKVVQEMLDGKFDQVQ